MPLAPRDRAAPSEGAANRRLLLVDDNPAIHGDIRKILDAGREAAPALDELEAELFAAEAPPAASIAGYEIDSAYQGRDGLELCRGARDAGRPYALAFVDVRMPPGWDGIETIGHLWKVDPDLQVVICTAYSDHSWSEIVRRLAPGDGLLILRKPFDPVEIRQLAHALTAKWNLERAARAEARALSHEVQRRAAALAETSRELARAASERARIERELQLAQRLEAIGTITTGIAHEIATPVQFIADSARLLRDGAGALLSLVAAQREALARAAAGAPPEAIRASIAALDARLDVAALEPEIAEGVERTLESADRIVGMVRAMKAFVHPGSAEPRPADLNRALLNTLTVARAEYRYVAAVTTELDDLPPVVCREGDLQQVFLNVVVNAAQAIAERKARTPGEGRIAVRTARDGADVVVSVSDNGPGIALADRARVFEPFFTTKAAGQGTGQGLALARALVERQGGTIWFETEVGVGTTFFVRLPMAGGEPVD